MREGEAPSYFNAQEAAAVAELVAGLLEQSARGAKSGKPAVQANDLGIIATYRKQVRELCLVPRHLEKMPTLSSQLKHVPTCACKFPAALDADHKCSKQLTSAAPHG